MRIQPLLLVLAASLVAACSAPDAALGPDEGQDPHGDLPTDPTPPDDTPDAALDATDDGVPGDAGQTCVKDGLYCGGGKVAGDPKTLYRCNNPAAPTVVEVCADGCVVNPGANDSCASCALLVPPKAAYLLYGLHPDASDGLRSLGITATGISQTIGSAAASAGTHAQDGVAGGRPYSAATDLRVLGKTESQIRTLLDGLAKVGFAAWYRKPGYDGWPSSEAPHIHAVYVGAPMKLSLRNQVRDWLVGKNGLASHTAYKFHTWPQCQRDEIKKLFVAHNPATN